MQILHDLQYCCTRRPKSIVLFCATLVSKKITGIFHMCRLFEDADVTHVDDSVDPVRDLDTITQELCLKDLAYLKISFLLVEV